MLDFRLLFPVVSALKLHVASVYEVSHKSLRVINIYFKKERREKHSSPNIKIALKNRILARLRSV